MGRTIPYLGRLLRLRTLAVCAFILSPVYAQSPVCYGNLGVQSNTLFSCQPSSSANTACCAAGDVCYSNGLCSPGPTENQDTATPFFWNGCTDPTFKAPECFSACYNLQGNGVQVCTNAGPNHYCCYQFGGCNCSDPSQVFSVAAATILTTINPDITHTPQSSTSPSTSPSTSTSAAAHTTSNSATNSAVSSPANSPTNSASSQASSATQSAPPAASSDSDSDSATQKSTSSKQVSVGVPIGVGVGIGVPLVLIIAALIFYILRRRSPAAAPPPPPDALKPYHHETTELAGYYNPRVELAGQSAGHKFSAGAYSPGEYPGR